MFRWQSAEGLLILWKSILRILTYRNSDRFSLSDNLQNWLTKIELTKSIRLRNFQVQTYRIVKFINRCTTCTRCLLSLVVRFSSSLQSTMLMPAVFKWPCERLNLSETASLSLKDCELHITCSAWSQRAKFSVLSLSGTLPLITKWRGP